MNEGSAKKFSIVWGIQIKLYRLSCSCLQNGIFLVQAANHLHIVLIVGLEYFRDKFQERKIRWISCVSVASCISMNEIEVQNQILVLIYVYMIQSSRWIAHGDLQSVSTWCCFWHTWRRSWRGECSSLRRITVHVWYGLFCYL